MAFQPVNNVAKFDCIFASQGTKRAQFSLYVRNDASAWDATQLTTTANAIDAAIVADYVPALSQDHDYLGIIARDLEVQFGRVEEVMQAAPVPGTLASPALPGNVAVVCTFKSAVGAPPRGRIFLLSPAESQVTGELLTAGAQGDLQDACDAISAAAGQAVGNAHVIVSRFSGRELAPPDKFDQVLLKPTPRASGVTAEVATVQVRSRVDTLKNRLAAEPA